MYTVNMSGNNRFVGKDLGGRKFDIMVEYALWGTAELSYSKIGEMMISAEKDFLNIAGSYDTCKNDISGLATLIHDNSVIHASGNHFEYDFIVSELTKMFNGKVAPGDTEASGVSIYDTSGDSGSYNAGSISILRTDGFASTFHVSSEDKMHAFKQFFNVN